MKTEVNYGVLLAFAAVMALHGGQAFPARDSYDPLAVSGEWNPKTLDLTVRDPKRGRHIPVRVYFPTEPSPAPVVLFSHGLGGSREGNTHMGEHWSARGYVVVFLQHPGSDTSVWKNVPLRRRMAAMQEAAGPRNYLLRVKDVPAVIDQIERWNETEDHALEGRLDLQRLGMSGHSFGAVTTQAVSGQATGRGKALFTDPRIKAAIAFSPSSPRQGGAEKAFGKVRIPWMLMTGTKDLSLIGNADMASRLGVYPALPPGGKYEVVLHNAEHSAFTDRALPGDTEERNPNHHRVILAFSTAFWDAYLSEDAAARQWLDGDGPASVLEKDDRWQRE
jgi:predicted dienelactone hydrolase